MTVSLANNTRNGKMKRRNRKKYSEEAINVYRQNLVNKKLREEEAYSVKKLKIQMSHQKL
jgi:hypothetical protein